MFPPNTLDCEGAVKGAKRERATGGGVEGGVTEEKKGGAFRKGPFLVFERQFENEDL